MFRKYQGRGSSFVEAIVSGGIAAVGISAAAGMQVYSDRNNQMASVKIEMAMEVDKCLKDIVGLGFAQIQTRWPTAVSNTGVNPVWNSVTAGEALMLTSGRAIKKNIYARDTSGTGVWPPPTDATDPSYYATGAPSFLMTCEIVFSDLAMTDSSGNAKTISVSQSGYVF